MRRKGQVAAYRRARRGVDTGDVVEQRGQLIERIGIGPVAERVIGVLVDFHEQRVDSDRGRRARQRRDELALAARASPPAPGNCTECVASKTTG